MKKSELRQIIREEINKIKEKVGNSTYTINGISNINLDTIGGNFLDFNNSPELDKIFHQIGKKTYGSKWGEFVYGDDEIEEINYEASEYVANKISNFLNSKNINNEIVEDQGNTGSIIMIEIPDLNSIEQFKV
jgi:hypothetical protein